MAKFYGEVGYVDDQVETEPGVYEAVVVERKHYGDILRNTRGLDGSEKVNADLTVANSISIVTDAYAGEHFHAIRYVKWAGVLWTVTTVEVQSPRLLLRLGVKYDGPTPVGAPSTP